MNATRTIAETAEDQRAPATTEQILKAATLLAQQKPTKLELQQAMRFIPDVLKADFSKVNRYDFCQLIGTPMPIHVLGAEIPLEIDNQTPLPELFSGLKSKSVGFSFGNWGRENPSPDHKDLGVNQANFLLICAQFAGSAYDLVCANPREMVAFVHKLADGFVIVNAPRHEFSGSINVHGSGCDIEINRSGRINLTLQPHDDFWSASRTPIYLVRRNFGAG